MNRTRTFTDRALVTSALVAASALAVLSPACSSSDSSPNPETDASVGGDGGGGGTGTGGKATGTGGKATGTGGKAAGGAGGSQTGTGGKATGTGGKAAGGAGGSQTDTDAGDAGPTPLSPLTGTALVVGSDFTAKIAEVVLVDLATGRPVGRASFADGDVAVSTEGGLFAVERSNNAVNMLSATGAVTKRISLELGDSGNTRLNPHSPLVVTGANKAYVPLNAANAIAIVDLTAGTQTGLISLASFLDATDGDFSTEPDSVAYDAATHRAFFILGRTNVYSGSAKTDYTPVCPPVPGLIIAIDTNTDTIVDLGADGGSLGIPLPLVGPGSLVRQPNGTILVVADGCSGTESDGGFLRINHGILSVDLAAETTKILFSGKTNDYLDGLLSLGDGTYALSQANGSTFSRFDPGAPAQLGAALSAVPGSTLAAGPGTLLGLKLGKSADGGVAQEVLRYDVDSEKTSVAATFSWSNDYSYYSASWVK